MNAWVESLGAALTHQPAPAKLDAKPAPEGEVLEVTVTVTDKAKPKDRLVVPFAGSDGPGGHGLHRISTSPSRRTACPAGSTIRPSKATTARASRSNSNAAKGSISSVASKPPAPEPQGGPGVWEHRVIGLCSSAPGHLAAPRPRLHRRQGRHLQDLSRQPPHPPRRRHHHADLDERQRHPLPVDRRFRVFCRHSRRSVPAHQVQ